MKRFISIMVLATLVALPTTGQAREQVIYGSFVAEATPMPTGWPVPTEGCMSGPEGLHRVSKRLEAPFSGWLHVRADFEGDWELGVFDVEGVALARSEYQFSTDEPSEQIDLYLRRGHEVDISVCNAASPSSAEVTYVLARGPAWGQPAGSGYRSHVEKVTYKTPAAATADQYVVCHVGLEVGCGGTDAIAPSDRWVYVQIEDDLGASTGRPGQQVSAEFYQYDGNTDLMGDRFCTSAEEGIRLKPGVDWVGVTVHLGPCGNGDPALGSKGEATLIFSNRRA